MTALFNLDAAVVLLTPLYVRLARRRGLDPVPVAFMPVLLASLASSALPVSNLTNLIVAERLDVTATTFLVELGPATLAATLVGWWVYRRTLAPVPAQHVDTAPSSDGLAIGLPVVGFLLVGFTVGDVVGVPAWAVVLVADVVLALRTGRLRPLHLPWQSALLVVGLGVVATGVAAPLTVASPVPVTDWPAWAVFGAGVVVANTLNNLPALLVGLDVVGPVVADAHWLLLLGVNMGPTLVLSGSLAGLLWADTMRHLGAPVGAAHYSRIGLRVGIPAMAAALLVRMLQPW